MSPLALRRYRAERLLREEFEGLRAGVLAIVRGRLRASGAILDVGDLEACYGQAWQGLYMAVLDGQEIANPTGWLAVVTFRRAIEEHRARARTDWDGAGGKASPDGRLDCAEERDLAAELDDRISLRQLFEALRGRLSTRELQAATLCYLQGFSRADAAAQMGVSEARMRKLMEGRGPARPGVAGKVGALVQTIRHGGWCEEQGSLMRGLAYGILDPEGERYRLALVHQSQCPACRAYVASLRGLAAVLPPPPLLWVLGAGAAAGAGAKAAAGGLEGAGAGAETAAAGAGGAGGAGGGWFLAGGGLAGKLAAGCALAVSVGAGCVALSVGTLTPTHTHHRSAARRVSAADSRAHPQPAPAPAVAQPPVARAAGTTPSRPGVPGPTSGSPALTPSAKAAREFGLEQQAQGASQAAEGSPTGAAHAAVAGGRASRGTITAPGSGAQSSPSGGGEAAVGDAPPSRGNPEGGGGPSAAEREFGIG